MRRGREQRSRPFGMNKEIVHGSGARRLMGGHGRPGLYECVYIHKINSFSIQFASSSVFFNGKLHMHPMGVELTTSPFIHSCGSNI